MQPIRRVVTGHAASGLSGIASDQPVAGERVPGMTTVSLNTIWGADAPIHYPDDGAEPSHHDFFPPVGGMRFVAFDLAPDDPGTSAADSAGDLTAQTEKLFPGLLSHFNDSDPGMHRTATTDMLYVTSGRCVLELDDGSSTELSAGDAIVQSGTMHRWSNPWSEPCRIVGFIVGSHEPAGG